MAKKIIKKTKDVKTVTKPKAEVKKVKVVPKPVEIKEVKVTPKVETKVETKVKPRKAKAKEFPTYEHVKVISILVLNDRVQRGHHLCKMSNGTAMHVPIELF